MRCAHCGNTWHQDPPDDLPIVIDIEPEPEPVLRFEDDLVSVPNVVRRRPASAPAESVNRLGWLIFAGVVGAILLTGIFFRNSIAGAWPPAARFYEFVHLSVETPSFGLELRNLDSSQTFDGDIPMLAITGQVVNVSEEARVVPRVRVALTNAAGREIYHWTFVVPDRELQPGQSTGFSTTLASPPESAKQLAVTFIEE